MKASRRMWSRRILRAGWLIAPIFAVPGKIYGFVKKIFKAIFYDYRGQKLDWSFLTGISIAAGVLGLFGWGMISVTEHQNRRYENADAAEIKAAATADQCVAQLLAQRLDSGQAVKRYSIEQDVKRCEDLRMAQQQKEALK